MSAIRRAVINGKTIHPMKEQRGVVLVVALLVLAVLSVLGLAFLTTARTEDTIASNYRNHTAAFYAAEAGLESGMASLKSLLGASPIPTDAQLTGIVAPALTDPSYTFNTFQVQRVRTVPPYNYLTSLSSGIYSGLNAFTTDYRITATVTGPRGSRARLTQTVQHLAIPLFQFGVLYGKGVNLDISPAPPMTFNGRVHANSNIYVGAWTSLQFDSFVTAVGNIHRAVNLDPADRKNNPTIKDSSGTYQTLNFDHFDQDLNSDNTWNAWSTSDWRAQALSTFGGRVQDSAMGVQEILPPIPPAAYDPNNPDVSSHLMIEKGIAGDSPDLKEAKIYYKADLIIENTQGKDKSGNNVNLAPCGAVKTKTFYDAREKQNMVVTEVDVGKLTACGKMPANGILYVSRNAANGAVRLVNGAQLPSQGLNVVSENPVYIQGDYNTVNKVPAAVMGDAVTVLSNNWGPNNSDAKGNKKTNERPATNTTVNAALAMGPDRESILGTYHNGGLENAIRFLEHWTDSDNDPDGATLTYRGSIVSLWHSEQATGDWVNPGNGANQYYRAPKRNWGYDTLFDTVQPPGTPMGIVTMRGQWSEG